MDLSSEKYLSYLTIFNSVYKHFVLSGLGILSIIGDNIKDNLLLDFLITSSVLTLYVKVITYWRI